MMITAQKPGDFGSKKFSWRFGDLKLNSAGELKVRKEDVSEPIELGWSLNSVSIRTTVINSR